MSPSRRDRRRHRPRHPSLEPTARLIHESAAVHTGNVAAFVEEVGCEQADLGLYPLGSDHPLSLFGGFSAPPGWTMVGVRVTGTARHIDETSDPQPTRTTFLVCRHGKECSLIESPDGVIVTTGPAEGVVADACRRVLGLPTAPAPCSPAGLFTAAWLDRAMEAMGDPDRRSVLCRDWAALAALHPALQGEAATEDGPIDPRSLVQRAAVHVAEWSWPRLRAEPAALRLPGADLPEHVTGWMDDGFYARWALAAFPPVESLAVDLLGLLEPSVRGALVASLEGLVAPASR